MKCTITAEKYLHSSKKMMVHSVYRHTVNAAVDDRIFAFHPDRILPTPLSLSLPVSDEDFREFLAEAGKYREVKLTGTMLHVGEKSFQIGPAELWDARIACRLGCRESRKILYTLRSVLSEQRVTGGFGDAVFSSEGPKEGDPMMAELRKRAKSILDGGLFRFEDMLEMAKSMIGLGVGLTPSGDDFLVGMLLAFTVRQPFPEIYRKQFADMVQNASAGTNDISRQYLRCACEGEFGVKLHRLCHAAAEGENLQKPAWEVLYTGHSSGSDTLNGLAAGLILAEKEQERMYGK